MLSALPYPAGGEVIRTALPPVPLRLNAARSLTFRPSASPLTLSYSRIGTEPAATNTTGSLSDIGHGDPMITTPNIKESSNQRQADTSHKHRPVFFISAEGKAKVSDRVASHAVGAALEEDDLGAMVVDEVFHFAEGGSELFVGRPRLHRQIQFCSLRAAETRLLNRTRPRIEKSSVFMNICVEEFGIRFEGVVHAVGMVNVNIDIGYPVRP